MEKKTPKYTGLLQKLLPGWIRVTNQDVAQEKERQVITASSADGLQVKKTEVLQQNFLNRQIAKINQVERNHVLSVEGTRLAAYRDYEAMEMYPIIGQALDIMAQETAAPNKNGDVLNVYSNEPRIQKELNKLFYDTLEINYHIFKWVRDTLKYGDDFVYLITDLEKGVVGARQIRVTQIERQEEFDYQKGRNTVKFKHVEAGNTYTNFNMIHFRLLSDDKFLPYGMSVLNKVRITWMHLIQMEDAMNVYRISRASERRVVKVYIGNLEDNDIEAYVGMISDQLKKTPQVNKDDGSIAQRYSSIPVDQDIFIPVRSGDDVTNIDTLQGASNLDQIGDIEYHRNNLFTGLGMPKSMLSYEGPGSEGGKNMAMEDVRFARKVVRFQQSILQELYKIAITHLYLLGYEDDLHNFSLTMNNPSSQADIIRDEALRTKVDLYTLMVDKTRGIAVMSEWKAKKEIFHMSEAEIVEDMRQQYLESVIAKEINAAPATIKSSGLFEEMINKYKIKYGEPGPEQAADAGGEEGAESDAMPAVGGGSGGGGQLSAPDAGIETGMEDDMSGMEPGGDLPQESVLNNKSKLIQEQVNKLISSVDEILTD